jgi:hypothetical protein
MLDMLAGVAVVASTAAEAELLVIPAAATAAADPVI